MPSAIEELIEAAAALPAPPESGSADRREAHDRLKKAVRAAKRDGALTPHELARMVEKAPLVGVTHASKILGIATPNFKRYRDRLTAIPVAGSADVFVLAEVEALAAEIRGD